MLSLNSYLPAPHLDLTPITSPEDATHSPASLRSALAACQGGAANRESENVSSKVPGELFRRFPTTSLALLCAAKYSLQQCRSGRRCSAAQWPVASAQAGYCPCPRASSGPRSTLSNPVFPDS